jgi:hypothetical protein
MNEPTNTVEMAETLRGLGAACLRIYIQATPASALYHLAWRRAGDRAAALFRRCSCLHPRRDDDVGNLGA